METKKSPWKGKKTAELGRRWDAFKRYRRTAVTPESFKDPRWITCDDRDALVEILLRRLSKKEL